MNFVGTPAANIIVSAKIGPWFVLTPKIYINKAYFSFCIGNPARHFDIGSYLKVL